MDNIYLVLDGIKGETTSKQGAEGIEVASFAHGVSHQLTGNHSHVGRTTGRCNHQDVTITKRLDKTSPTLNSYCSGGKTIKTAHIRCFGAVDDGSTVEYYTITLTDVIISGISVSSGGGDRPFETVSFNYNEITWRYTMHDHDKGGKAGNVVAHWSLQEAAAGPPAASAPPV